MDQSDARALVAAMHSDLMPRDATSDVLDALTDELAEHGDCARVLHQLTFSDEYLERSTADAYQLVFRREPSPDEASALVTSVRSGKIWPSDLSLILLETATRDQQQTTAALLAVIYDVILDRELTVAEMEHWTDWAKSRSRSSLPRSLWNTREAVGHRIARIYRAHLWRDPDPSGISVWGPRLADDGDEPVRAGIVSSLEYLILARARWRDRPDSALEGRTA